LEFEVAKVSYRYSVRRAFKFIGGEKESSFEIEFVESLTKTASLEPVFTRFKDKLTLFELGVPDKVMDVSTNVSALSALVSLLPSNSFIANLLEVTSFLWRVRYYELDCSTADESFVLDDEYQRWRADILRPFHGAAHTNKKIIDLYFHRPEVYAEFVSLVGPDGLGILKGVDVYTYPPIEVPATQPRLHYVQFGVETEIPVAFGQLSFGTQRLIHLVLSILYDQARVYLIEQPEDGIHSHLIHKLTSLLRAYADGSQIFFASHSATILNEMLPEEIRLVEMSPVGTTVRALSKEEVKAADFYLQSEGSFSDFLSSI